jgi:hypothetical protein
LFWQQPLGHDWALQAHEPLMQTWPCMQALLKPHLHWPPEQLSAPAPQGAQVAPAGPHEVRLSVWH